MPTRIRGLLPAVAVPLDEKHSRRGGVRAKIRVRRGEISTRTMPDTRKGAALPHTPKEGHPGLKKKKPPVAGLLPVERGPRSGDGRRGGKRFTGADIGSRKSRVALDNRQTDCFHARPTRRQGAGRPGGRRTRAVPLTMRTRVLTKEGPPVPRANGFARRSTYMPPPGPERSRKFAGNAGTYNGNTSPARGAGTAPTGPAPRRLYWRSRSPSPRVCRTTGARPEDRRAKKENVRSRQVTNLTVRNGRPWTPGRHRERRQVDRVKTEN